MASTNRFIAEHEDEYRTSAVVVGSLIHIPASFTLLERSNLKLSLMKSTPKRAGRNFEQIAASTGDSTSDTDGMTLERYCHSA